MTSRRRVTGWNTALHRLLLAMPLLSLAAVAGLLVVGSCGGSGGDPGGTEPQPTGALEIAQVKVADWRTRIGETVEVRGLLRINEDGTGVLCKDLDTFYTLGYLPQSDYLPLTFEDVEGLDRDLHQLSEVTVAGVVQETTNPGRTFLAGDFGDLALCEIGRARVIEILKRRWAPMPEYVQPCENYPALCDRPVATVSEKYAILYCGGLRQDRWYECFWNEIVLYYAILVWRFGFDPENITVIYKDGVPEREGFPVDYPAKYWGLNQAFYALQEKMDGNDLFFLFMTNHGGTAPDEGSLYPGDEFGSGDTLDETGSYWEAPGHVLDEHLGWLIYNLSFGRMCCIINQCLSGGFIHDLRGPNRVICTASRDHEGADPGPIYSPFSSNMASALIGYDLREHESIDADEDGNGQVSMYEAFRWAAQNDTTSATPQYEDSGEGISIDMPTSGVTTDGLYGSTFYL